MTERVQTRSLYAMIERAAVAASRDGVEVVVQLPDGTTITARRQADERSDDLSLRDMSR